MPATPPTLCLCMIVKDEAAVILRALESVAKHISHWVICDTGSSDDTPKMIQHFFDEHNIQGELHRHTWKHFGHNRSELVSLANKKADYLLMLDADMNATFGEQTLSADGYLLPVQTHDAVSYELRILKAGLPWTYSGTTREFAYLPDHPPKLEKATGIQITHGADGASRAHKYERDLHLLEQEIENFPDYRHAHFCLAETHAALMVSKPGQATHHYAQAMSHYTQRITMGGDPEEVFYAMYKRAITRLLHEGFSWEAMGLLLEAHSERPQRIEPLYEAVRYCRKLKHYLLGMQLGRMGCASGIPPDAVIGIRLPVYAYLLKKETAECAAHAGVLPLADALLTEIIETSGIPENEIACALRNRALVRSKTKPAG